MGGLLASYETSILALHEIWGPAFLLMHASWGKAEQNMGVSNPILTVSHALHKVLEGLSQFARLKDRREEREGEDVL